MPPRTNRRHRPGDETRQRILDATIEIAAERGYQGTTVSQIAERAAVSMSSIYWHFADKDAVLAAVIERSFQAWSSDVRTWQHEPPPPGDRKALLASIRADIIALTRHPEFLRFGLMLSLERLPSEPTARAMYLDVRRRSLEQLERALDRHFDASQPDRARQLAAVIMAAADGLFIAAQVAPDTIDLPAAIDLILDSLLGPAPNP